MAGMNRLIMTRRIRLLAIAAVLASAAACTINPVTGQRQLALISAQDEVALGEQHYAPTRQMQGGDFVLDPELARYVASVGQRLAAVSDRDLPYEFAVLNSSVPNAWALPGGKIAINRGLLLELDSEAELAAVLGHEIVHAAARHSALAMQRGMLLQIPVLVGAVAAQRSNFGGLAVGAAAVGAQLIGQRYGRAAELESDEYGMEYMSRAGYDPQAAVSLQETFLRLSGGRDDQGWLAGLFASHPPSGERVEQNRRTAARLQAGGEVGRERYQAAIATLRSTQPAYDAHDQGRAALADGQLSDAERLAAEALRLEPREGHFHALMGDVEFQRQNWRAAANRYGDAIARNDRFFYYHLRQGLARQRLGESQAAEVSLEASVRLLPTADAYFALGQLAEQRGDRTAALERYRIAADSQSPSGQAAQDAVVRLDLPQNPGTYLGVGSGLDGQGQLIVEVANPTRVPVTDVAIVIRYTDAGGARREAQRRLSGTINAGASQRVATGLGPFTSAQGIEIGVISARSVSSN
jgi:beta-barrel assembly-enhancing protease